MKHTQPERPKISHVIKLDCGCDGNDKPQVETYPGQGRRVCYHHATEAERTVWLADRARDARHSVT